MFHLELEYQFDFLANNFVVPSVLVWGLGSSRKRRSYPWKVWCLPVLKWFQWGCWQVLQSDGYCVGDGRGDGLVVVVLFCPGDSFEDDEVDGVGVTLLKIVEALGGAFFFTKGTGGGGVGREIMDSNTSSPSMWAPKHFSRLFDLFLHLLSRQVFGTTLW